MSIHDEHVIVVDMASGFSPQNEQFLAQAIAEGLYPSKEAALDAAVSALREKSGHVPLIAPEHEALVYAAWESSQAGRSSAMNDADWNALRETAQAAARRSGHT